uniref:Uncharacterized protein n=1 Tax=Anolis carolinensis TaxID=28377 RepID=A0A803TLD2_ANOCA
MESGGQGDRGAYGAAKAGSPSDLWCFLAVSQDSGLAGAPAVSPSFCQPSSSKTCQCE